MIDRYKYINRGWLLLLFHFFLFFKMPIFLFFFLFFVWVRGGEQVGSARQFQSGTSASIAPLPSTTHRSSDWFTHFPFFLFSVFLPVCSNGARQKGKSHSRHEESREDEGFRFGLSYYTKASRLGLMDRGWNSIYNPIRPYSSYFHLFSFFNFFNDCWLLINMLQLKNFQFKASLFCI